MTIRRTAQLSLAALVIGTLGATAVADAPASAWGVPGVRIVVGSTLSVRPATGASLGRDPLVPVAVEALTAWNSYAARGDSGSLEEFQRLRNQIATEAAARAGVDPARMVDAWRSADTPHQLILMTAFTQLGTPYHGYKRIPGKGFDCSGFTGWVYEQSGVVLGRSSRSQIRQVHRVTRANAQPGDLVYYPGHITLYLGVDNAIIHAPNTGRTVMVSTITKHLRSLRFGDPLAGRSSSVFASAVDWAVPVA